LLLLTMCVTGIPESTSVEPFPERVVSFIGWTLTNPHWNGKLFWARYLECTRERVRHLKE
jgi:hypothetical protein